MLNAKYAIARFCLLEQCLPNGAEHPFASTMLKHFEEVSSPLRCVKVYQDLTDQKLRFLRLGWSQVVTTTLWSLWSDDTFFSPRERATLNSIEPFDEWEEFALFACHYCLIIASNSPQFFKTSPAGFQERNAESTARPQPIKGETSLGQAKSLPLDTLPRSYGVLSQTDKTVFEYHGGYDGRNRTGNTISYLSSGRDRPKVTSPGADDKPRMHHTSTRLNQNFDCLLVGGRSSPDNGYTDCWLRRRGKWEEHAPLPRPLYRHCACFVTTPNEPEAVLVFGGRSSSGIVSSDWFLWRDSTGWIQLGIPIDSPSARFGATMISLKGRSSGFLLGGLGPDGRVKSESSRWELNFDSPTPRILFNDMATNPSLSCNRFGASLVHSGFGLMMVGGVSKDGLPTKADEIVKVDTQTAGLPLKCTPFLDRDSRDYPPFLFFGHSVIWDGEALTILGGGATCFSFGKHMNSGMLRIRSPRRVTLESWEVLRQEEAHAEEHPAKRQKLAARSSRLANKVAPEFITVEKGVPEKAGSLLRRVFKGKPFVFEGQDLGACTGTWTTEYLKRSVNPECEVGVHISEDANMKFEEKNFEIQKRLFSDFIDSVVAGEKQYLRSLSRRPADGPANFERDFGEIAADFKLPSKLQLGANMLHSSILRVSGPVHMWLHYDVRPVLQMY